MISIFVFCFIVFNLSDTIFSQDIVFPNPTSSNCGPSFRCMRRQACRTVGEPNFLRSCGRNRGCCPLSNQPSQPESPRPSAPVPRPSAPGPRPSAPGPRPSAPGPRPSAPVPRPAAPGPRPAAPAPRPSAPRAPSTDQTSGRLTNECGVSKSNGPFRGLVMGGSNVSQGTFPWMAAVMKRRRNSEELDCTGFMIDRQHALSAAHCFRPNNPARFSLRIGDVEWRKGTNYEIEKIDIPEGYRHRRFYDDIAVITLKRPVTDPNFVPICLPTEELTRRDLTPFGVTVSGWGSTRYGGEMSDILLQLSAIPVISNEECGRRLREQLTDFGLQFDRGIVNQMLCAGFLQGGKDSCGGDSGGPLMLHDGGFWYAVGIVSFGFECGLPGYPAGYTRVTSYLDYIRRHTS